MSTPRRILAISALAALLVGAGLATSAAAASASESAAAVAASHLVRPPVAALGADGRPTKANGVDDFSFDSFDGVYGLGRDSGKHSTLTVTETLVAEFPTIDQNRGIIRAIPADYDGHPTEIHVSSVTDGAGNRRSFDTSLDGDFYDVTIAVPKGQYVHGAQTYVISYTQKDVTRYFDNTGDDEFYWDINGTGWPQPFAEVSAKVTLASDLVPQLNGKSACYFGAQNATTQCEISGAGGQFTAKQTQLAPYQTVTVALGFAKGTFATASTNPLAYIGAGGIAGAVLAIVNLLFGWFVPLTWRAKGTGIVVAQYAPPPSVSAIVAANIVGQTKRGFAASLVDFAVRGKLKIHVRKSGLFGTGEQFGVQPLDNSGLDRDEASIFTNVTYGSEENGVIWLQKNDTTLGTFVRSITKTVADEVVDRGLRTKPPRWAFWISLVLSVVSVGLMGLTAANGSNGTASTFGVIGAIAAVWFAITALGRVGGTKPLSKDGALLKEYLEGLKLYIRFAEADRLKMLQSVSGAERIDTTDAGQVVKIYEKLLPYATLFGLEQEWAGELGKYYAQNPPDWYDGSGVGAFNAGYFAGSIASFGSSVSSSYSGSAVSSSSGGSGGGGGAGGGGGGGGGGGI